MRFTSLNFINQKFVENSGDSSPSYELVPQKRAKITPINTKLVHLTCYYIDDKGNTLRDPIGLSGEYNSPLAIPKLDFNNYTLIDIQNEQPTFIPNDEGIVLVYHQQLAAPVMVFHTDEHGKLLVQPQIIHGELDGTFKTHALDKWRQKLVKVTPEANGRFSKNVQIIRYFYQTHPDPYQPKDKHYVRLMRRTLVFRNPRAKHPMPFYLPKYSVWRVFEWLHDTDRKTWLNLGGVNWITSHGTRKVKMREQPKPRPTNLFDIDGLHQVNYRARINMDAPTIWSQPYGDVLDLKLPENTVVDVSEDVTLTNHTYWSKLAPGQWIESRYLTIVLF